MSKLFEEMDRGTAEARAYMEGERESCTVQHDLEDGCFPGPDASRTDYTIGPTTRAAMEDARAGRVEHVDNVETLMADLNAEERKTRKPAESAKQFGSSMVRALNNLGARKK